MGYQDSGLGCNLDSKGQVGLVPMYTVPKVGSHVIT